MPDKFRFEPTPHAELGPSYDLVVVGSGAAGLTSAIQARELGLQPIVLEKMTKLGGNSTRASSGMNAAETTVQLKHQVVDSYEDFYQETYLGGGKKNNQELLNYFTTHSALAISWLAEHGIHLDDLTITGGMSKMRTHRPASMAPIGAFLVTELLKQVQKLAIPVFDEVKVMRLLLDDQQKISGLEVIVDGEQRVIATKAVILATGGFGSNPELITQYRPDLAGYKTTNQPGATGDGIVLAEQVGAKIVDMDQVQIHPTVQQDNPHTYLIGEAVRGEGAILVNKAGRRFVNELDTRKVVSNAIDGLNEQGAFLIFGKDVRDRVKAIEFYDKIGLVKTGATLAELAAASGIDLAELPQTVATWNAAVTAQNDAEFGRKTGMDRDIATGPFYSIHIAPAVHYTMGGVAINHETQVLRPDDSVISGLYAAGEIVGGLHGNNRIGGNSISETVIFGRQAGQQVYRYLH